MWMSNDHKTDEDMRVQHPNTERCTKMHSPNQTGDMQALARRRRRTRSNDVKREMKDIWERKIGLLITFGSQDKSMRRKHTFSPVML